MELLYKNKKDIVKWLEKNAIENYTIVENNKNYFVNVQGSVDLSHKNLNYIPVVFNHITGDFNCSHNNLPFDKRNYGKDDIFRKYHSFLGMPQQIDGHVDMSGNLFKDKQSIIEWLEFHKIIHYCIIEDPEYGHVVNTTESIRFDYKFDYLRVKFNTISGFFYGSHLGLKSLEGSPKEVHDFVCRNNDFTTLKYCPEIVHGDFICDYNRLEDLDFMPQRVGGTIKFTESFTLDKEKEGMNNLDEINALIESQKLQKILSPQPMNKNIHKI